MFFSDPFLIVANAPCTTGKISVLTFHTLLTSVSRSLYVISFPVSFVLNLNNLAWLYRSVGKSSHFYDAVIYHVGLLVLFYYFISIVIFVGYYHACYCCS